MGNRVLRDRTIPNVYGVGYMGNNFELKSSCNGKKCPIYDMWYRIIERCYSKKLHDRCPTYTDCCVSDDFKDYSKWRKWYDNYQYKHDGWQLDKDLLVKGNKIYSSETCVFLPHIINSVLTKSNKTRGNYLIGVYFDAHNNKFKSYLSKRGKKMSLGYFENEMDAHLAYKTAKEEYLKELAEEYKGRLDPKAYNALKNYVVDIDD